MVTIENHIGKISVSDNYISEIVRHAVCDCFGVADVCNVSTFRSAVSSMSGGRLFKRKGVAVKKNDDGKIELDLHIKVSYGTNISAAVESVVHKVGFCIEEAVGIKVSKINVFVDDINC